MSRENSSQELVDIAALAGFGDVTCECLRSWARRGLMQRPGQAWQRGRSGSLTLFPLGSDEQMLAICEHHYTRDVASLRCVGFWLWWDGRYVEPKKLPKMLSRALFEATGDIRGARGQKGDYFRLAEDGARRIAAANVELVPGVKKRIPNPADLMSFNFTLLMSGFGASISWGEGPGPELSLEGALATGLGASPEGTSYPATVVKLAQDGLAAAKLPRVLATAKPDELDHARVVAKGVFGNLPGFLLDTQQTGTAPPDFDAEEMLAMTDDPHYRTGIRVGLVAGLIAAARAAPKPPDES